MRELENRSREVIGIDFMCKGQQHHTYHVGLMMNAYLDRIILNSNCRFDSPYLLGNPVLAKGFHYSSRRELIKEFVLGLFNSGERIVVIGVNTKWIPLLSLARITGKKIEVQLHGQIAGLKIPIKRLFWRFFSLFLDFTVANPIYSGPDFVRVIGNQGAFDFLEPKPSDSKICLMYGSNKEYLTNSSVRQKLKDCGYAVSACLPSEKGYVSCSEIVEAAKLARYTVVHLDYEHYKLSPSGRVCDLQILNLIPIVVASDHGTQKILREYGIAWELI